MRLVLKLFYSVVDVAGAALQRNCSVPLKLLLQTGSVAVFSGLRTKMAAWVRDSVMKLIKLVEANDCLWNVKSSDYHNLGKSRIAIANIAYELGKSEDDVKKKIHTLRAQFSKERTKMKYSYTKSANGSKQMYKTKWEYFEPLQFMFLHSEWSEATDSAVVARESHRKNIEEVEDSLESACQSLDNTEVGEEDVLGFQESAEIPRTPTPQNHPRPSLKRKKTSTELQEQAVISSCMSLLSKRKPKDEFSIFGDFVASEIRNLKNAPDLQWKLKRAIQGSILEISDEYAQRTFPHASPISVSELSGPSSIIVQQVDSNYDALSFKL